MSNVLVLQLAKDSKYRYDYIIWTPSLTLTPEELGRVYFGADYKLLTCTPDEIDGSVLKSQMDAYKSSDEYNPQTQITQTFDDGEV